MPQSEFQIWMKGFEDGTVSGYNAGFEEGKRWILRQLEDQKNSNTVPFRNFSMDEIVKVGQ